MPDFKKLEFIRITQPEVIKAIPRYLFEQIEGADDEMIERIYLFGQLAIQSPTTLLYVLVNEAKKIKGVLWASVDIIGGVLFVKIFSVDKEYQGGSIKGMVDFLTEQLKNSKITRLECYTERPKSYERIGWKKSKQIHLEYEVNNGTDAQDKQERDNTSSTAEPAKS